MYGRRVGLVADWRRMFAEAARLGKALELDATVWRQDLDVELATLARSEGVRWFSIGSDAHAAQELELVEVEQFPQPPSLLSRIAAGHRPASQRLADERPLGGRTR
jgi:hypothetical protein